MCEHCMGTVALCWLRTCITLPTCEAYMWIPKPVAKVFQNFFFFFNSIYPYNKDAQNTPYVYSSLPLSNHDMVGSGTASTEHCKVKLCPSVTAQPLRALLNTGAFPSKRTPSHTNTYRHFLKKKSGCERIW